MKAKKLTTSKITVIAPKPAAQIKADCGDLLVALSAVKNAADRCERTYISCGLHLVSHIPSGLGAHEAAHKEYSRVLDAAADIIFPATKAANVKTVRDYLARIIKAEGYSAPTRPLAQDEKTRKDAAKRKALSDARKVVKKQNPNKTFTPEELTEAATAVVKEKIAEASAVGKDLKIIASVIEGLAKQSYRLQDLQFDFTDERLTIAAAIAGIKLKQAKMEGGLDANT